MAEARVRTPDPQRLGRGGRGIAHGGCVEQLAGRPAGPAVEHAADRAEAGAHDGVGVGPHRGGDPGGEGRRGEVVVGQQDERGVEGGDEAGLCPSSASRVHNRPAIVPRRGCCADPADASAPSTRVGTPPPSHRQAVDHRRDQGPPAGGDRAGPEVGADGRRGQPARQRRERGRADRRGRAAPPSNLARSRTSPAACPSSRARPPARTWPSRRGRRRTDPVAECAPREVSAVSIWISNIGGRLVRRGRPRRASASTSSVSNRLVRPSPDRTLVSTPWLTYAQDGLDLHAEPPRGPPW